MHVNRLIVAALAVAVAVGGWVVAGAAQQLPLQPTKERGASITGAYEGWYPNPDGTFTLLIGYFNRNRAQTLDIPVGPNNRIEPGGPDRGQPTFFYTRTQRNLFTVAVPKDWGKKELIWTLTVNGKTERAYGWLQPEWEIDPSGGAATGGAWSSAHPLPP